MITYQSPRVQLISKISLIFILVSVLTVLHYSTNFHHGLLHDLFQRLYYIPVVLGGLWFCIRGGLLTALVIAIVYFPHIREGWSAPYDFYYRLMEIGMYFVIGALTGALSSRIRAALDAEKSARQEKENAYERLRDKTDELFSVEEQLRRSDRLAALGRLSAGLAHEIRNPLASIKTAVEILRDKNQSISTPPANSTEETEPDFHKVLLEETDRLNQTLSNFLEYARAESDHSEHEPSIGNIGAALDKTQDLLAHPMQRQKVTLKRDPAALDIVTGLSETHLRQIFLNLFLNSLDVLPEGGEIRIRLMGRESGMLVLTIEDTGPGIKPEHATHVFDPFFTTKRGGTGLGLSIVERIISHHGGAIRLEGNGKAPSSRFVIHIPEKAATSRKWNIG